MEDHWPPLIRALTDPARFPHPVERVEVVETHISYVLLTGDYAYKIKKPLDLGFLDFSTLAKRREACEEEVRINRRTAPDLYLGVVPITGSPTDPGLEGDGEPFEVAVRMAQFDPAQRADRCLERGELTAEHLRGLGRRVADLHEQAAGPSADEDFGTFEAVRANQRDNLAELGGVRERLGVAKPRLEGLERWVADFLAGHEALFRERRAGGRVRECHGDLHLANLVLHGEALLPFDAIEFNPALRYIDVMADAAFTWMDLRFRGRPDLGAHFLNRYLEGTGDYPGARLLSFYTVYRALVRAKVAGIQAAEAAGDDPEEATALGERGARYFALAEEAAHAGRPLLVITRGVTGTGKSHLSGELLGELAGIRIRSDVERKRLAGLGREARSGSEVGAGLYSAELTGRTYARLLEMARPVLDGGLPVLLDATFLDGDRREEARALAREAGVPFAILSLEAPEATIREWLRERARAGGAVSEGDEAVLDHQLATQDPLTAAELPFAVRVDPGAGPGIADIARRLRETARAPAD